jgi:flagellar basal-body rod modification protein FlgD
LTNAMEIAQTPPQTATAGRQGTDSGKTETPETVISSDFETFLKMLTVQMENQDPLNPTESEKFATQLATFSGVEQQVLTNDLLESMIGRMGASDMAQMAAWVGREARAPVPGMFDGAPITVAPDPAAAADRAELVVTDAQGAEVQRLEIPVSGGVFDWQGRTADGTPLPPGHYWFNVVSYAGQEVLADDPAEVYARVTEVRAEDGETRLMLEGGAGVPATQVSALREAGL